MKIVKNIRYYLKSIKHFDLVYNDYLKDKREIKAPIIFSSFRLMGYEDNSYVEDFKNKKSIMKYCYFINTVVISWYSKKQRIISIFIIEAKYITFRYII